MPPSPKPRPAADAAGWEHPIVGLAMRLLTRGADAVAGGSAYDLPKPAAARLRAALAKLKDTPEFTSAVRSLALFAFMLERDKASKAAARGVLAVTEAVAGPARAAAPPPPPPPPPPMQPFAPLPPFPSGPPPHKPGSPPRAR